jgi:hypothetical protein
MKAGRGRRQLSLPPSLPFLPFLSIPSSKLLVSDSLQGSNSHISEAKNTDATYIYVQYTVVLERKYSYVTEEKTDTS